ncbi:WD40-repeat-containing domain protein [Pyronema domesticum]|uniref:Protein transport protein SEC13 n=1 Tax=Pyronema omphalodes (strain CBS 100304) TaxID=1076935 RepID=U4KUV7_PYROM|nr:WD40-repeat-containing domain protein [Pyronema domesticum]CCX04591.1 Similar to Protein transport protein SEC13; acc. no. Q6BZX5 [Pyronema omphalodes CBS 100304]
MTQLANLHEDMIHDCQLDYYGKRLATCSSDKTIKIFEVDRENHRLLETLRGHDGPVWEVSWAHPKFGNILASASYDGKALIWQERQGQWSKMVDGSARPVEIQHTASVNSVKWGPHELGAVLACASSDGKVSVLEVREDRSVVTKAFDAHKLGCNSVSWAPVTTPGSLVTTTLSGASTGPLPQRRLVTGGSDNVVRIWLYNNDTGEYTVQAELLGHSDWVRDVAWAPSVLPRSYIASASQDKSVIIWIAESPEGPWVKKELPMESVMWKVSWSLSGNVLVASGGDNKVTMWKENSHTGEWFKVSSIEE